jgi:hypothetical protein
VVGASLVALLAAPLATSSRVSAAHNSDAQRAGTMPAQTAASLSRFLLAHRHGARYEVVSSTVTKPAALIIRDAQPVLMLTSLQGRPLTSAPQLAAAVRSGAARYALLGRGHCTPRDPHAADCAPAVVWARAHGTDVSAQAGLRAGLLYQLSS